MCILRHEETVCLRPSHLKTSTIPSRYPGQSLLLGTVHVVMFAHWPLAVGSGCIEDRRRDYLKR